MSHSTSLYKWKRFQAPREQHATRKQKKDDIQKWLEKVEAAADSAVQSAFDLGNSSKLSSHRRIRFNHSTEDDILQLVGDIHDNEAAHVEAKEIVSDWISDKIRYDFLDDKNDEDVGRNDIKDSEMLSSGIETAVHEKWYEDSDVFLQKYLNSEKTGKSRKDCQSTGQVHGDDVLSQFNVYEDNEGDVVNALMNRMMETPVIKPNDMKVLRKQANARRNTTIRPRDPKTSMDIRHKEVKEARLRRQKEEEKKKLDKMIQKEAKLRAQKILKDEEMQKKLKKKQDEDAIQAEMAKIRKEMIEQRKVDEKRRREYEIDGHEADESISPEILVQREDARTQNSLPNEKSNIEKREEKISQIMIKRNGDNRRIMQSCFSTWCKLVLQQRVKLGKANALADWKCMQKSWTLWKSHIMNYKLERETESHQASVRDMRIKEKKAVQCARVKLLRKVFLVWKVWVKGEQERKDILKQQQSTKAKMKALLDAVVACNEEDNAEPSKLVDVQVMPVTNTADQGLVRKHKNPIMTRGKSKQGMPKEAWQVTKKDVQNLKPKDMARAVTHAHSPLQSNRSSTLQSHDPYENRHKFQKELIDQQRALLHEQKQLIDDMQEQRRLAALQKEITELKEHKKTLDRNQTGALISDKPCSNTSPRPRFETKATATSLSSKKHPIVEKMEKRALERAERKKELEDIRRKKEEEKRRMMQEEEERKCREEEEKKRKEFLERKEAKRNQQKLEEEKKAAQERMKQLCKMSDQHHTKSLMKFHGFLPWLKLIQDMKEKLEVAKFHDRVKLIRKTILGWQDVMRRNQEERNEKSNYLNKIFLLRRGMARWKKYGERMEILEQKAVLHHNKIMTKNYLRSWVDYTTDEKLNQWRNESRADQHNRIRLQRRVFNVLRSYRKLVKLEVERRQRIEEMRKKVTRLLPDFQYSQDSFISDNFDDADDIE